MLHDQTTKVNFANAIPQNIFIDIEKQIESKDVEIFDISKNSSRYLDNRLLRSNDGKSLIENRILDI